MGKSADALAACPRSTGQRLVDSEEKHGDTDLSHDQYDSHSFIHSLIQVVVFTAVLHSIILDPFITASQNAPTEHRAG